MSSSRGTTTPKTPELDFQRTVLHSGVRVLTTSMPHTGAVSIQILFGAGSRYEPDDLAGSSHLFEHLLFKGTRKRPTPREIAEVIEGVGGVLNAYTDREVTGYWCKVGAPHARNGLDVLIDMFRGPLFREEDVAREKQVVFEEIRATHDSPEGTVDLMLDNTLWPDQPMGRDIAGSIESVESVSTEALKEYLRTQYVASNTVIAVAGAVRHEDVVQDAKEMLGDFGDGEPLQLHPFVDNLHGPSVALQNRGTEQAHLAMGFHGVSNTDPDRYALRLLSTVMGGSMSSRLFEEVREKRGLAYSIHSGVAHFADTGALQISSGVDPQRAEEAVKVVMEELDKMRAGVTDAEFRQARELVKGRLLLRMEESRAVASSAGTQELLLNEVKTVEEIIEEYEAVERDDLARVAERVLNSGKLALSVVGPFDSPDRFRELLKL